MKYIKIYGLPRSCTNFTEVLINTNFRKRKVLTNYPDWKHGCKTFDGRSINYPEKNFETDDLKFIICTKHPYSWLWSLFTFENRTKRKPDNQKTFKDFFHEPAWHYRKEKWTPIKAFNVLTKHWLSLYPNPNILQQAKHESINTPDGQEVFCKTLEENFDLETLKEFTPVVKRIQPNAKIAISDFMPNKHEFDAKTIKFINENLDPKVVKLAGYELVDWREFT